MLSSVFNPKVCVPDSEAPLAPLHGTVRSRDALLLAMAIANAETTAISVVMDRNRPNTVFRFGKPVVTSITFHGRMRHPLLAFQHYRGGVLLSMACGCCLYSSTAAEACSSPMAR